MIPEYAPDDATPGERIVFAALRQLPDDGVVYFEPIIRRRWPDFVVILPSVGVVVVEVKSMPLAWITSVDWQHLQYMKSGNPQMQMHPARQAVGYMRRIMQACNDHPQGEELKRGGHFAVAFGHLTILTGIRRQDLDQSPWADFFPRNVSLCADELERAGKSAEDLVAAFRNAIDPELPKIEISARRMSLLRAIINPPARLPRAPGVHEERAPFTTNETVETLDIEQERAARTIGAGHRILYGVPGSGKTVILIAIAKMLAEADKKVLFLCYNKPLQEYLASTLSAYSQIKINRFGAWATSQGALPSKDGEAFGNGLFGIIGSGAGEAGLYDAILIDEGQDFWPSWFKCAVQALSDPMHGTLIVAYDLSQNLYGVTLPTWSHVGIQARGRTRRFLKNYRNTKEIVSAAYSFGNREADADEDKPQASTLSPANCIRSGSWPMVLQQPSRDALAHACVTTVKALIDGVLDNGGQRERARPEEIMVLCKKREDVIKLSNELDRGGHKVRISTIHSARGLQSKAIILAGADDLIPEYDRSLMYVALTRPTDILIVLWSHETPLTKELLRNLDQARGSSAA